MSGRVILALAALLWVLSCLAGCKPEPVTPVPPPEIPASAPTRYPFQEERWRVAVINSIDIIRLDKAVALFERERVRYVEIEDLSGVPASVIFVIHGRESTWNFSRHLHNGDPLTARTKLVPAGRPKTGNPPFTFVESAVDALEYDGMARKNWASLGDGLQALEAFNGLGYQKKGRISPYLWAGTDLYVSGKYVRDGVYSATAVDKQLGVAAILKRMEERGLKVWPMVTLQTDMSGKVAAVFWIRGSVEF